jgi:hypothetical protein
MAAEMWYYTTEGKQMDPVSIRELRRLVDDGLLKPTDMVWKDGMARWVRASSIKELFPDPGSELDKFFSTANESKKNAVAVPVAKASDAEPASKPGRPTTDAADDPRPQKRKRRSSGDDDDDRPSRRRNEAKSEGNSGLVLIALILGGGLVVFAIVVGVLILIFARGGGPGNVAVAAVENPVPIQLVNKSAEYVEDVPPLGIFRRTVRLRRGATYQVTVNSNPRQPNVDLFILTNNGAVEVSDVGFGPDSTINDWSPRDDGDFKLEVRNLDRVSRVQSKVTIRETAPAPGDKKKIDEQALPKDVFTGNGSVTVKGLKPGEEQVFKFRVKAGHNANVKVIPFMSKLNKKETDFNLFVVRDADGAQLQADSRPTVFADVNFRVDATEIIRVRVVNAGKTTPTKSTLYYNVSP